MKRIIKIPMALILVSLLQVSCNKSWLKPEPLSTLTPENVYVNEAGF